MIEKTHLPWDNALQQWLSGVYWQWQLLGVAYVWIWIFAFPDLADFYYQWQHNHRLSIGWQMLEEQSRHPFQNLNALAGSHEEKLTFRLLLPLFIKLTGLPIIWLMYLRWLLPLVILHVWIRFVYARTADKHITAYAALAMSSSYFLESATFDLYGWNDTYAYCLLLLAWLSTRASLVGVYAFLAYWVDERALIASAALWCWHAWYAHQDEYYAPWQLARWNKAARIIGISWVLYLALRAYLGYGLGLHTHTGMLGWEILLKNLRWVAWGAWSGLEGWWWCIGFALWWHTHHTYGWTRLWYWAGAMGISVGVSFLVLDVTRSLAYIFPINVLAVHLLAQYCSIGTLRRLAVVVLMLCWCTPNYFVIGDWLHFYPPLYVRAAAKLIQTLSAYTGHSPF